MSPATHVGTPRIRLMAQRKLDRSKAPGAMTTCVPAANFSTPCIRFVTPQKIRPKAPVAQ
eukprot:2768330-Pyramimonas_sp.AAC.1